jgi:nucleoid-associated protein YgaU
MPGRYQFVSTIKSDTGLPETTGKTIYQPTYYPNIETKEDDTYIISKTTDRLDLIAYDFYGDSTLWWVIAMVNNLPGDSIFPPEGAYLRIPSNLSELITKFLEENR